MPPQQRQAPGPSLGEIGRLLETMRGDLQDFRSDVNRKFDRIDGTYVRRETYDALATTTKTFIEGLTADVEKLQNNQAWVVRTIVGAILLLLIGGLVTASKAVGAG